VYKSKLYVQGLTVSQCNAVRSDVTSCCWTFIYGFQASQ